MAEDLNDDCLGRTLDWLYAHDVTRLFAGLALRARRAFGIEVGRLHADTTSFAVHGHYALELPEGLETPEALTAAAQSGTAGAADGGANHRAGAARDPGRLAQQPRRDAPLVEPREARPGARPRTLDRGADPGGRGAGTGHAPAPGRAGPADVGKAALAPGEPDLCLCARCGGGVGQGLPAAAAVVRGRLSRGGTGGLRRTRASAQGRRPASARLADPSDAHPRPRGAGA